MLDGQHPSQPDKDEVPLRRNGREDHAAKCFYPVDAARQDTLRFLRPPPSLLRD